MGLFFSSVVEYKSSMISICLNLCKEINFRPAATALKIVFDWLDICAKIPTFDSMRVWSCRVGIAQLKMLVKNGNDWIWISDHSNQIGQEKVLPIIGIRVSDLPPLGETPPRDKMVVLATIPGTSWTREDVRREYDKLAKRIGPPKYLLTDGAVELRESADVLEINGENPILLRDMKHYAANVYFGDRNEAMGARKPRHHPHLQTNHRLQRIRQKLRLTLKYNQKYFQHARLGVG